MSVVACPFMCLLSAQALQAVELSNGDSIRL